ncbi:MAG: hypothetical protein WC878_04040 [Candidatus Paceibacterota bacterium]|jgi:hypothetical protein
MTTGEKPSDSTTDFGAAKKETLRLDEPALAADFEDEKKELKEWRKKTSPVELEKGMVKRSRELIGGANKVFFVEFIGDESGIFKPASGEFAYSKNHIEKGTLYKRERAAYLADYFFNFGIVPPTIIREIDGEEGSVQRFIPDTVPYSDVWKFSMPDEKDFQYQMKHLWIFDFLIHNSDRRSVNLLFSGLCDEPPCNITLHAIDNGCSFSEDKSCFAAEFYDEDIPEELTTKIKEFAEDKHRQEILRELLLPLLTEKEINAFFARVEKIAAILKEYGKIPLEKREEVANF